MMLYRLVAAKYANALSSSGAANRWNRAGQHVIYTSGSISLCALELLAHTGGIKPAGTFKVMLIHVAEPFNIYKISTDQLPPEWNKLSAYAHTQYIGSEWYTYRKFMIMRIPSAIIPSENNFVINTRHPDFASCIQLRTKEDFFWDSRFPAG